MHYLCFLSCFFSVYGSIQQFYIQIKKIQSFLVGFNVTINRKFSFPRKNRMSKALKLLRENQVLGNCNKISLKNFHRCKMGKFQTHSKPLLERKRSIENAVADVTFEIFFNIIHWHFGRCRIFPIVAATSLLFHLPLN